jgi:GDP-4-dehydro-6-deoxy-D-mannose reductase
MKKILITGDTGFVGKELKNFLKKQKNVKISGFSWPRDIRIYKQVEKFIKKTEPDFVFHLAAKTSVSESKKNEKDYYKVNVEGTKNLLESLIKICPNSTVLIPSSCEVYKKTNRKKKKKENWPLLPDDVYGKTKKAQEDLGFDFYKKYGLKVILVRAFNITGSKQKDRAVCGIFAKKIALIESGQKSSKIWFSAGINDFIDVRDAVRAYWLAIQKCKPGEIYNICSGKGYKLKKILDTLISFSNKQTLIRKNMIYQKSKVNIEIGDNSKFKRLTGWKPRINILSQTLPELLSYWRKIISNNYRSVNF